MLGLGLSLQKGVSAFNAGRALVSSYIRRVTDAGGVLQNTACDAAAINELNQDRLLEPASWVLVPDGIKEDVVYTQKPSTGLGDLTFTRASDATYTDSTGVVRRSPYNLFQQSEMFSNAIWSKSASTIGIDSTLAPNGTLTADKLQEDSSNGTHLINQPVTNSNSLFSFSIYAKKSERDFLYLQAFGVLPNNFTYAPSAYFNLNTGVVSSVSNATATIESVGNGWYRCTLNCTSIFPQTSASVGFYIMTATSNGVNSYVGTTGSGIFIWGAQVSTSTSALDYFPTTNRQDVPRIDFRNADGTLSSCGRLLLEPQRTNVLTYSEQFDNAAWTKDRVTVTTNATTAPDGTVSAEKVVDTLQGANAYRIYNGVTLSAISYAASFYVKAAEYSWVYIRIGNSLRVWFNVSTGVVGNNDTGITGTIQSAGNGWYRCTAIIATATAGGGFSLLGLTNANGVETYTPSTGGQGVFVWGAQLEAGAYATTYIPTTTAAVTRIGDSTSKAGLSSLFGTEGTWFIEISPLSVGVSTTAFKKVIGLYQVNGSIADCIYLEEYIGTWGVFVRKGNSTILSRTYGTQPRKLAVTFGATGSRIYIDGVQAAFTASNTSISPVQISAREAAGSAIETVLNVSQMAYFPTPLTQSQLAQLTTL